MLVNGSAERICKHLSVVEFLCELSYCEVPSRFELLYTVLQTAT